MFTFQHESEICISYCGGTLAKRPSTAMSEEKLLPSAGYTMCNNSITAKQVNKS